MPQRRTTVSRPAYMQRDGRSGRPQTSSRSWVATNSRHRLHKTARAFPSSRALGGSSSAPEAALSGKVDVESLKCRCVRVVVRIAVPNDRTLWPGQAALRQDPRPLDRMADAGACASDHRLPTADDFERHSAPLLLQEPAGLLLVVVCVCWMTLSVMRLHWARKSPTLGLGITSRG